MNGFLVEGAKFLTRGRAAVKPDVPKIWLLTLAVSLGMGPTASIPAEIRARTFGCKIPFSFPSSSCIL
jgi:hypothetical protein